jgi:hypothetical protein
MADEAAAGGNDTKSPWNSLEIARLIVAAATSLALFGLGYLVSLQNVEREKGMRDEARADQFQAEFRSALRDALARREAKQDAQAAREVVFQHELAMRRESEAHDAIVRREMNERERSAHQESVNEARLDRILERRTEFWNSAAPVLLDVHNRIRGAYLAWSRLRAQRADPAQISREVRARLPEITSNMNRIRSIIDPNVGNFSQRFVQAYDLYLLEETVFLGELVGSGEGPSPESFNALSRLYEDLVGSAQSDLVILTPTRPFSDQARPRTPATH